MTKFLVKVCSKWRHLQKALKISESFQMSKTFWKMVNCWFILFTLSWVYLAKSYYAKYAIFKCTLSWVYSEKGYYAKYARKRISLFTVYSDILLCPFLTLYLHFLGLDRVPNICLLYTNDHDAHIKVVKTFIQMMELAVGCSVTCLNGSDKETTTDLISLAESKSCDLLQNSDVIIVVHSEYLNLLVRQSTNVQTQVTKVHVENNCIIKSFAEIKKNPTLCQKTISVYFDYTDKSYVTLLGSECLFFLPLQISNLRRHILNKTDMKQTKSTAAKDQIQDKERRVCSAVKSSFIYQKQHQNWLTLKLFHTQPSCSCDDSGIMVTNQCIGGHRNTRSRSLDSVCKCNKCQPLNECSNFTTGRPRSHSFDFSFSPPDTISIEESVRLSLLEGKMVALNNSYDFVMRNNSNLEEEEYNYLTMYGNSV